ncbi:alpha-1,3-glucosyltransferase [Marchantia polymorpha subsp. ruderalis]|uniref:Alpha-1,3-glucosyltransferase n=2 Tax=Marchantia polymorpha TaxID=3197 RepID=A0A176VS03_MARPO|nr:hypothetical protein AXG93_1630s1080 [Marchantia polymorpha subsp. ruderalis]PTQ40874.1 hypothetical protein MARPO_0037s0055 [Marchantia polymorpha]BBN05231.1 hypothetical protein Mp_3g11420 [Marchantia polymorpha subsp. ruderalis]|eukprot:PTQ40874.1 hypothetical protein MARPO_0037s0055 [Marchantia polymorpha]
MAVQEGEIREEEEDEARVGSRKRKGAPRRLGKRKEPTAAVQEEWRWPYCSRYRSTCFLVMGFAFLLRVLVSLHSYSGAGTRPKFGDYEAQRHWMEITVHTPVAEWYRNTTDNDLTWWGLDYPPVTAYQSFVHGWMIHAVEPEAVALHSSRGYESPSSKILMRWTVLSSDMLVFFPAALWFINEFYSKYREKQRVWALAMVLLHPALMLIDHGHFQYNCISLGLAIAAAAAVISERRLLACVLFSLSLNHKQMSAYYAPAFLAHLLGRCFQSKNLFQALFGVIELGITVILTFTVCWWPYLESKETALELLSRLAPMQRGLYEDYVANFWCGTAMLFKWKQQFAMGTLAKLALGATISACLPSMVQQIYAPSRKGFVYSMLNCSLAFYFFSYQVHEKSVLLPVIPVSLLAIEEPQVVQWFIPFATFSMLPLLLRDGLLLPYIALMLLFFLISRFPTYSFERSVATSHPRLTRQLPTGFVVSSVLGAGVLHLMYFGLQPPRRYPYLFEALIMAYTFAHFVPLALYMNWKQWSLPRDVTVKQKLV